MKKNKKHSSNPPAILLQHAKNVLLNNEFNVIGDFIIDIGDKIQGLPEPFTPTDIPFPRPPLHLPRRIFRKDGADNGWHVGSTEGCNLLNELDHHPLIVLLGDAGMGKSDELKWICHDLKDSEHYHPIYRQLNTYNASKAYLDDIPHINQEVEGKIVLVLDGLDETDIQLAKAAIEKFCNKHPQAKIIVSCRSNAYADTLSDFEAYFLDKLGYLEIHGYVNQKLGDASETFFEYWNKKYAWNQNQLIDIPFFLVRICEFVQENNNRPPESLGEMFEYLIDKCLDLRLKNISRFGTGNYESLRLSCKKYLEKLAFVMECRGNNIISEAEFTALIPNTDEQEILLAQSSLIEPQGADWRFTHNNFQEYLAAKALSRAKSFKAIKIVLAAKPDFQRLKWTWVNALSFLLGLWDNNGKYKKQLLEWLIKDDLDPLIKICSFERDKVSPDCRERIFKHVFEYCKKEDFVIGSHHYNYRDLGELWKSPEAIRYLTEELNTAETQTVKGNALILLKVMRKNFLISDIKNADLKALLLQNIYDFEQNTPINRHTALETLIHLFGKIEEAEALKMAETFFDAEHALERSSAYHLIEVHNLRTQFMERLIDRINELDHGWSKGEARFLDEDMRIESCFENISSEKEVVLFFEKYPCTLKNLYDHKQKPLNIMLKKLSEIPISENGAARIFKAMKDSFSDCLSHHPPEVQRNAILNFIDKHGFSFEFFKHCIDDNTTRGNWLSLDFLDEQGIGYIVEKFRHESIDIKWLENYQTLVGRDNKEMLFLLNQRVNEVSEEPISLPEIDPPIDYNQCRLEKLKTEKELYFNREKYIYKTVDIFKHFKKDCFNKDEIYRDREIYDRNPRMLIQLIDDHPGLHIDDLKEIITKHWDLISIRSIQNYIENHQQDINKHPEIGLNDQELDYVKNWCDIHHTKVSWDGQHTYADLTFIWFVTHFHFLHYPTEIYLNMVSSGFQNYGMHINIFQFLEQYKPELSARLRTRVLENLKSKKVNGYELSLHFDFIKRHFMTEAIYALRSYFEKHGNFSHQALRVYIELGGDDAYLLEVLKSITPTQNDFREQTLLEHFSAQRNEAVEKILLKKLTITTEQEHQLTYARYLVRQDNLVGLKFLANYIDREKKSPFSAHIGNPDHKFENPSGIPILLRFFDYGNDPTIPQDNFDSISSVGRNMVLHLAACQNRRYFQKVRKAVIWHLQKHKFLNKLPGILKKLLKISRPEVLKQLRYLLKDLEFNHYQNQPVTIEEAVKTWKELNGVNV